MPNVCLVWEMGSGLGHLARLLPLAEELTRRGHTISVVSKNPERARVMMPFAKTAASPRLTAAQFRIKEPTTFADVLYNAGADHAEAYQAIVADWLQVFHTIDPAVVVFDHSPHALLASQCLTCRRVLLGTGFASPPDESPMRALRDWEEEYPDRMQLVESTVLNTFNQALEHHGQTPLPRVSSLFTRVDENALATFGELDHFQPRQFPDGQADYFGVWSRVHGLPPAWPSGDTAKVFGYLKPFAALPALLQALSAADVRALIYAPEVDDHLKQQYCKERLQFSDQPLDMKAVGAECDLAILNAGHAGTAQMLLAGKPILQIPLNVEQYLTAMNVCKLRAGAYVHPDDPQGASASLNEMLASREYTNAANTFAQKYASYDSTMAIQEVSDRIEALVD